MMWTRPVEAQVSQATRASGSWVRISSRMASEIWSQILSGCPSVTDSEVNRCLAINFVLHVCGESCTASYTSIKFAQTKTLRTEALSVCTLIFRFPAGFGTLCFRTGCRASQGLSPQPLLISRYSVVFREISYHLFVRLSRRVSLFLDISTKLIRISPRSTGSFPKLS